MSVISLAISFPLSAGMIGVGRMWGGVDQVGVEPHKTHADAVPNLGGIAIYLAVVLPVVVGLVAVWAVGEGGANLLGPAAQHQAGLRRRTAMALAIVLGMTVLHLLGLVDDRRGLSPRLKVIVEAAVALVLAGWFEVRILQFLEQLGPMGVTISVVLSALWMVAIINAINMLDNMDGLAAGVAAIICAVYLAATLLGQQWFVASLCALLLGTLLGFLCFNFPPARLYMGDGGSLVIGLLLAVISVRTTYYISPVGGAQWAWYGVLMPLVVMAVPIYDLVSVCWIRLRAGRSPFVGDQNHFSHRLVRRGLSRPTAVLVIWLCTAATGIGGAMFPFLQPWQVVAIALQTVTVLGVLVLLERGR